jgi:hypothetical protein
MIKNKLFKTYLISTFILSGLMLVVGAYKFVASGPNNAKGYFIFSLILTLSGLL